ncbi:MAG: hypothetical protein VYC19_02310 [Pseudomonadota bacterium]|nr:hypothetical protein [Pseudomonadota bacterium]MEE3323555.1 hypothetical protein [Pseudomonadota bacterium]
MKPKVVSFTGEDVVLADESYIVDSCVLLGAKQKDYVEKTIKDEFINYPTANGDWVSFRESKADFAPSESEFLELRRQVLRILGRKSTAEFDDKLHYLITFMREQAYKNVVMLSVTEQRQRLSRYQTVLQNLIDFMDDDSFDNVQHNLMFQTISRIKEIGADDPIYTMYKHAHTVKEMCTEANEALKGRKSGFTPNDMRQILAEELAREIDKMGVEPKKYQDGAYFKILRATLEMISCTVRDKRISISIPENLFKMAKKAIDDYPTKEPFSLLNFD